MEFSANVVSGFFWRHLIDMVGVVSCHSCIRGNSPYCLICGLHQCSIWLLNMVWQTPYFGGPLSASKIWPHFCVARGEARQSGITFLVLGLWPFGGLGSQAAKWFL